MLPLYMQIFGTIQPMTVDQSDETGIHEYNNYANFPSALLLIIRVSTGENWQDVMLDSRSGQLCNNCTGLFKDDTVRCGSDIAIPFYITFYCISVILVSCLKSDITWEMLNKCYFYVCIDPESLCFHHYRSL